MKNAKVAAHLRLIAQMEQAAGSGSFKVKAFTSAAEAVEALRTPVEDLADPESLPSVGKSAAAVVRDFLARGASARLEALSAEVCPHQVMEMTQVRLIGPKTAYALWQDRGIASLDGLIAAAAAGQLADGKYERHLAAIREVAEHLGRERVPRDVAALMANWVRESLAPYCRAIQVCGSVRRGTPDSKDIDVVALVDPGGQDWLVRQLGDLGEPLDSGGAKATARVERYGVRMEVDLWMAEEWHYGATVLYATGSKRHHVAMRALAQGRGLTLNDRGLFKAGDGLTPENQVAGRTEESLYEALHVKWVPPEERLNGDLVPV